LNPDDVPQFEMKRSIGSDDAEERLRGAVDPDLSRFAEDLRNVFPDTPVPEPAAEEHVVAMMEAVQLLADPRGSSPEPVSRERSAAGRISSRRWRMRHRMTVRIAAVATGMLVSLGGLAIAGAFPGGDDPIDESTVVVNELPDVEDLDEVDEVVDAEENSEADESGDADEQGEDAEENDDADDQGEDAEENDDADENENDDAADEDNNDDADED
jgi:hypothetical protein